METGLENKENIISINQKKRSHLAIVFFAQYVGIQEYEFPEGKLVQETKLHRNTNDLSIDFLPELSQLLTPKSDRPLEVSVMVVDEEPCLVPNELFDSESCQLYLGENGANKTSNSAKHHHFGAEKCQLVFGFSHQLEKFLVNLFPSIQFFHEWDLIINELEGQSKTAVVLFNGEKAHLFIQYQNQLVFANYFEVKQLEDFLYYYHYALKKCELSQELPLKIRGEWPSHFNKEVLETYVRYIDWPKQNQSTLQYLLEKMTLCAS